MKSYARGISACIVLMFLLVLPVTAAENLSAMHNIEIRQAHLAWTALDKEVDMRAAIAYCGTLYGSDTTSLRGLLEEFLEMEARIPSAATDREVDALIADMRNTTEKFRADTLDVMTKGQGKWDALNSEVSAVKNNNPYIQAKQDAYWAVRKENNLADFDAWVRDGQQHLDGLKSRGYDTTSAQRALDVFSSKRPDVEAALKTKAETAIQSVNQQILPLSEQYIQKFAAVQQQVPDSIRFGFFIEQGNRAVELADRINFALVPVMIDIGEAESILAKTKTDLAAARNVLNTGNLGAAKAPLILVRKDFIDLAQAYRDIARTVVLPGNLSEELNTMAFRLDYAADQMGEAL